MPNTLVRLCSIFAIGFLTACGGGDTTGPYDDPDDDPDPGDDPPAREVLENPSFGEDIQEIFNRKGCSASTCHGAAQENGLDLRSGASYGHLVNVAAFGDPDFLLVEPNDPENSYLVMKLEGRQTEGERMPLDGSPLDNIDLTNIRNWIANGAPRN